ncbi:MAG: type 4a pilus biogenesis protein PilO [Deltaproteobacteria bacterium]|nr:type 4a pilus biogenesis protein PilO [Deltaproteobacteria bacterium]
MTSLSAIIRLFLLFVLAIFILLFFYIGLYSPKEQRVSGLEQETQQLEQKLIALRNQRQQLSEARPKKIKSSLEIPLDILNSFPEEDDIPSLLSAWTKEGKKMGIEFLLFKPLEEKEMERLVEMPIEITLRGTFSQTLDFFTYLSKFKRKILISNIEMTRPEKKEGLYVVSTHALATTFRRGEK